MRFKWRLGFLWLCWSLMVKAEERPLGFSNQNEFGYVVTGGNSQSETTSFKQTNRYHWLRDTLSLSGHYIQSRGLVKTGPSNGTKTQETQTTAENWSAKARYDRLVTPKRFTFFLSQGWRGDRFQGVALGQDSDFGSKYYTLNTEEYTQFFELGYRYTKERLVSDPCAIAQRVASRAGSCAQPEFNYLRIYAQIDYTPNPFFSLGFWIEYLPSLTNFKTDQRINYSPSLTSTLTDLFSLKVTYESRYRFEPAVPGNKTLDFSFTTSLLAEF